LFRFGWILLLGISTASPSPSDYLTGRDLALIRRYWPVYRDAAAQVGIPVMMLPAVHARESDFRTARGDRNGHRPVHNMGGPFMMDRGADGERDEFDRRIRSYEIAIGTRYGCVPVPRVRDDLSFACLCAAAELRDKSRGPFWDATGRVDREVVADALWGYNGRSSRHGTWMRSPYVFNHPKKGRRFLMRITARHGVSEYLDSRPGTLILYMELERRMAELHPEPIYGSMKP